MNETLRPLMNRFVTVYMDDIVIYSGTTERVMPTETQVVIPVQKGTVMVRPGLLVQPFIYDAGIKSRNNYKWTGTTALS